MSEFIVENNTELPVPEFEKIGTPNDFNGEINKVIAHGKSMALCKVNDTLYAVNDVCPGDGVSLSTGSLKDFKLFCSGDDWSYDVRTGKGPHKGSHDIATYEVKVEGDNVLIGWMKG